MGQQMVRINAEEGKNMKVANTRRCLSVVGPEG